MQCGSVEGHTLHIGNVAREIGQAGAVGLVWVTPVLEELLEQRGLAALGKHRNLGREGGEEGVAGGPAGVLRCPVQTEGGTSPLSMSPPNWIHPSRCPTTHLGLLGVLHL